MNVCLLFIVVNESTSLPTFLGNNIDYKILQLWLKCATSHSLSSFVWWAYFPKGISPA